MKAEVWEQDRKILKRIYILNGITRCEVCGSDYMLGLHHLDKRSSLKAENSFEQTRLLCQSCHYKADQGVGHIEFNDRLRRMR